MRGGFPHNRILADRLERAALAAGATVDTEHRVALRQSVGFIDLLVVLDRRRIAIEVECSAHRVDKDVAKARAAQADLLLIVTPDSRIADACVRKLRRLGLLEASSGPTIKVCTLPVALQELANFSGTKVPVNTQRQNT